MNKDIYNMFMECALKLKEDLIMLSDYILENPELGYEEYLSSKAHINLLEKHNFHIVKNLIGIETAFYGIYDSNKPGPTVGYFAEYDALPEIGHRCGHNVLGTTSTSAAIILSKFINDVGGKVVLYGTPAEESGGTKVTMTQEGVFDNLDIALIAHPESENMYGGSLAINGIELNFEGKSSCSCCIRKRN